MTNYEYVTRKVDFFEFYGFFSINLRLYEVKLTVCTSLLLKHL